ncbi:ribonuclease H, partial [Trifolium medium]|nr:ribonuclease H [Trifolium medium]
MHDGHTLMNLSTQQIVDTTLTIKDTLIETGNWDLNFLTTHLPQTVVNQLVAIPSPKETDGPDSLGWIGTNTRQFTVQSAYYLQRGNYLPIAGNWKSLWNWKGPHRIQTFMWIAAHERLLTNYRRSIWGNGIDPTCPTCGNGDETIIHVLRDCVYATQ